MKDIKNTVVHFFKGTDKLLLIIAILTSIYGTICVYSATYHSSSSGFPRDAFVMIAALVVGVILALFISLIDYDVIYKFWPIWAAAGVGLMLLVMSPLGVAPEGRPDAQVWLNLGFFYFQPSELVKILFIITFSMHLNAVKANIDKPLNVLALGAHALVPTLLVMKSGDDGSAAVFLIIAFSMIFMAGLNWKYIVAVLGIVLAAVPLLWFKFFNSFQKQRFIVIFNPDEYPDVAYQQNRGLTAISSGGFLGQGFLKGAYTQAGSVPVSESDMIFTVVCEEFGFLGALGALALLVIIVARIVKTGKKSADDASTLMCYGMAALISAQTIINVAMCLRVGPVIGITLPFFSSGGSSSLCLYIGLGLVFSAYRTTYNQKPKHFRLSGVSTPFRV